MFDFIMWSLIMTIPFLIMSYLSLNAFLNENKLESSLLMLASLIPAINWLGLISVGVFKLVEFEEEEDIFDKQERFNKSRKCRDCGINSKYGRLLMHKHFNGATVICPVCSSHNISTYSIDEDSPLSKSLSLFETFTLQNKINKYYQLKDQEYRVLFTDSQLEKYQIIQEKKLKEMLKYKEDRKGDFQ